MCTLLYALFGRDTRGAQILNYILSTWWFVTISLTGMGVANFEIPYVVLQHYETSAGLFLLGMLTAMMSFITTKRPKQVLKAFALMIGVLNQAILANAYLTEYPPLDMMMCISTVLALFFSGAVLYIFKCEGLNGVPVQR